MKNRIFWSAIGIVACGVSAIPASIYMVTDDAYHWSHQLFGSVAQLVEQLPFKQ